MSNPEPEVEPGGLEDVTVDQRIISAEPPPALLAEIETHLLGVRRLKLHQGLFHPNGESMLGDYAKMYNFDPPRETTEAHADGLRESLRAKKVQTYFKPMVAVLAPQEFRSANSTPSGTRLLWLEDATDLVSNTLRSGSRVDESDSEKLGLILLDGRGRYKVLLEHLAENEKSRKSEKEEEGEEEELEEMQVIEVFVQIYDAELLKSPQALFDLLHGTNHRHSHFALPVKPSLADHLRSICLTREADKKALLVSGEIKSEIRTAFYSFTSSRSRSTIALPVLRNPIVSLIAEKAKPSQVSFWFNAFGAASCLLFVAVDSTFAAFKLLEGFGPIFTPTFFWFFSKLASRVDASNPFGGTDLSSETALVQVQTRGVELAKKIFKVVDSFHVDGILRLDKFTAYFGDWLPPWSSTEHVRLELALEVVAQFQALADRLGDIKHHRFEDDFPEKFVIYEDLLSLNPRSRGTELTRLILICESHVLTPLFELFSAYVQLSCDDSSLQLPPQYRNSFEDPEPFLYELMMPGQGIKSIKKNARRVGPKPKDRWTDEEILSKIWERFIRHLWIHHREIILDILASKARFDALTNDQQQVLLDHFLDKSFQNTPQGEIIRNNLHLSFFRVGADRSLVPTLPPSSFGRCNAWLRTAANALLAPVGLRITSGHPSHLFASHLDSIKQDVRFPVQDSDPSLDQLVNDLVDTSKTQVTQDKLASALDSRLANLDCFRPDAVNRPDSPAPVPGTSGLREDEDGEKEDQAQEDRPLEAAGEKVDGQEIETEGEAGAENLVANKVGSGDTSEEEGGVGGGGETDQDEEQGEGEGGQENVISAAQSKASKRKSKKVDLDAAYRPPVAKAVPLFRRSSTLAASSDSDSASFAHDNSQILPRNADADDVKPDLRTLTSSKYSTDPETPAAGLVEVVESTSLVVREIVKKFRKSDRYPPLGISFDPERLVVDDFVGELKRYLYEGKGNVGEETEDRREVELQDGFDSVRDKMLSSRIHLRTLDAFIELLLDSTVSKEVYSFWEEFAWKVLGFD